MAATPTPSGPPPAQSPSPVGPAPRPAVPYSALPWLTLALIAVGIVYQYVLGRFGPDALASAPALLEGASDDAPDVGGTR